jgi:quinolinate synthase
MHSDFIGSTSKLLSYVQQDSSNQFIVATETGIFHQMKKAAPEKEFIPAPPEDDTCSCNECPYMKLNTMEKLYLCMKNKYPEIVMDEEIRKKALIPIERMLAMS